jgi:hypothetical protein
VLEELFLIQGYPYIRNNHKLEKTLNAVTLLILESINKFLKHQNYMEDK